MTDKSPEAYKTISEAAEELGIEQHVLRFWETKFPQIKPLKRRGGRRFYRPEDMDMLRRIHALLKNEGFTIKGAKKALADKSVADKAVGKPAEKQTGEKPGVAVFAQFDLLAASSPVQTTVAGLSAEQRQNLTETLVKLESARNRLQSVA